MGHDLRLALRQFRKAPLFSLMAVLSLAVGIGATTAVHSIVDRVLPARRAAAMDPAQALRSE